jgi:hypothetical protein
MRVMSLTRLLFAFLCLFAIARSAAAGELWLASGAGFDPGGLASWQAATSAPMGGLADPGPRLSLFLWQGGSDAAARLEAGWSFAAAGVSGNLMGGVEARHQDRRRELSPVIAAALEVTGDRGGLDAMAMLRPGFGEVWLEVRPWLDLGNCRKLGALAASAPGPADGGFRAGVFGSGYRLVLPLIREVFLGAELGLAGDRRSPALSPFASLNLGFDL